MNKFNIIYESILKRLTPQEADQRVIEYNKNKLNV